MLIDCSFIMLNKFANQSFLSFQLLNYAYTTLLFSDRLVVSTPLFLFFLFECIILIILTFFQIVGLHFSVLPNASMQPPLISRVNGTLTLFEIVESLQI